MWMVSAAHKSSGKTTLSIGLAAAMARRGLRVQTFKKGPDYIDPMWLSRASGRDCINLDPYLMTEADIRDAVLSRMVGADVGFVEGNKGLYDGLSLDGSNSNAALARLLDLPVVLVIDARGMTRGIAPLLLGYQAFDREMRFAGVILNQLGGSRHEAKLRAVIEHYTDLTVLGAVQHDPAIALDERHLGLMPDAEVADAHTRIGALAHAVDQQVDLSTLIARCAPRQAPAQEPALHWPPPAPSVLPCADPVRIAVARDAAFGFYYADDLAALQAAGAELCFFDTLLDPALPAGMDGLFIGGGFPEMFLGPLSANHSMRASIRAAVDAGLPTYAECGGLMYLSRRIHWKGREAEMVGVIPGEVTMQARPVGRGYVHVEATEHHPWLGERVASGAAVQWRGHEFHHSRLDGLPEGTRYAWRVSRGHGIDGTNDGVLVRQCLASYTHLRHAAGTRWPEHFVAQVRQWRQATRQARHLVAAASQPHGDSSHVDAQ
ncbi:MAG: cobyrinate a,c-diamide synthase [Burkholderiales bacterium]|nr:cobyrinate a,c-diamide synthase [Burkholderiales bacterium]